MSVEARYRYLYYTDDDDRECLRSIGQNATHLTLSGEHQGSLEIKVTVANTEELAPWFHLTHVRREKQRSSGGGLLGPFILGDGLCLSSAPQHATTLEEYKKFAYQQRDALWTLFGLHDAADMVFDHEWWRYCDYSDLEGSLVPKLGSLFDLSGLDANFIGDYSSLELISKDKMLALYLNYNNVTAVEIPKAMQGAVAEFAYLFEVDSQDASHDRSLEGVLTSLRRHEDVQLMPTLVFPMPQHVAHVGWHASHSINSNGLHPSYKVALIDESPFALKPEAQCTLHFSADVPKQLIVDRYQLEGLAGRAGDTSCIREMQLSNNGDVDLELPDYKVPEFGSTIHLTLDEVCVSKNNGFQLPLHLRYGSPNEEGVLQVQIPHGDLYWRCPVRDHEKWSAIRDSFHYEEGLLGVSKLNETIEQRYYHIPRSDKDELPLIVNLPVAEIAHFKHIELATLLLIVFSSLAIVVACLKPVRSRSN